MYPFFNNVISIEVLKLGSAFLGAPRANDIRGRSVQFSSFFLKGLQGPLEVSFAFLDGSSKLDCVTVDHRGC